MIIALTVIVTALLVGLGVLICILKPESLRLVFRFFKIVFELEMKLPRARR